jgi:hypothetical protein
MYARVVRWEGAEAEAMRQSSEEINSRAQSGPPEGVPAKGFLFLQDPQGGKVMAITFFETEDDYRQGDETLNSMSPPGDGLGSRVGVDKYEVAFEIEA